MRDERDRKLAESIAETAFRCQSHVWLVEQITAALEAARRSIAAPTAQALTERQKVLTALLEGVEVAAEPDGMPGWWVSFAAGHNLRVEKLRTAVACMVSEAFELHARVEKAERDLAESEINRQKARANARDWATMEWEARQERSAAVAERDRFASYLEAHNLGACSTYDEPPPDITGTRADWWRRGRACARAIAEKDAAQKDADALAARVESNICAQEMSGHGQTAHCEADRDALEAHRALTSRVT